MHWQIFQNFAAAMDGPLTTATGQISGALQGYLTGVIPLMIAAGLAVYLLIVSFGTSSGFPQDFARTLVFGALVYFCATSAAWYGVYVSDLFTHGIPDALSNVITGADGAAAVNGGSFDELAARSYAAALALDKATPWYALLTKIVLSVYVIVAYASVAAMFLVWYLATVITALAVALGPIFIALFVWPMTRELTMRWISTLISAVIMKLLSVTLLSIMLTAVGVLVAQIAGQMAAAGGANNTSDAMADVLAALALFGFCAFLTLQIPGLSASLSHGLHIYIGSALTRIASMAVSAPGAAIRGAGDAAAAASAGVRRFVAPTVGLAMGTRPRTPPPRA